MKRKLLRLLSMLLMVVMVAGAFGGCGKSSSSKSSNPTAGTKSSSAKVSGTRGGTQTKTSTATGTTKTSTTSEGTGNTSSTGERSGTEAGLEGGGDNQPVAGPGEEEQPKSDVIVTEKKIDLGGMELTIWAPWFSDPENGDVLVREGISPYYDSLLSSIKEAEKKYNCKITYLNPPGDERQPFLQAVMAGQVPCTALEANIETAIPGWSDSGVVTPLDDYINFNSHLIIDFPIKGVGKWKGVNYGYPAPVAAPGSLGDIIHYNRNIFTQFGIEDPQDIQDRGQWTWDTFVNICQKLTVDMNGDGVIDQYALGTHPGDLAHDMIYSNGGRLFDFDSTNKLVLTVMDPKALRALNFVSDLVNVYKVVLPFSQKWVDVFRAGKIPMLINGVPSIKYFKDYGLTDEVGIVSMPIGPDSPPDNLSNVAVTTRAFFFPSTLNRKEDVIPVVCDAMTNWDTSKSYFVNGGNGGKTFTAWEGIRRPQDFLTPRDEAYMQRYANQSVVSNEKCIPNFTSTFNSAISKALNQETTIMSALESIRSPLQAILDGMN